MKFRVYVSKEWTEPGEVIVDAKNADEARELANEMLADGSEEIRWNGSNMDPGQCVESVTPIKKKDAVFARSYLTSLDSMVD